MGVFKTLFIFILPSRISRSWWYWRFEEGLTAIKIVSPQHEHQMVIFSDFGRVQTMLICYEIFPGKHPFFCSSAFIVFGMLRIIRNGFVNIGSKNCTTVIFAHFESKMKSASMQFIFVKMKRILCTFWKYRRLDGLLNRLYLKRKNLQSFIQNASVSLILFLKWK